MFDEGKAPIIRVVRKKKAHEGHHGGSWKVAYADFVTAMMAFFLVMWVVGMNEKAKDSVQAYFQDPAGYRQALASGASVLTGNEGLIAQPRMTGAAISQRARMRERANLERLGAELESQIEGEAAAAGLGTDVHVTVTEEGLRIELAESGEGNTFFRLASAQLEPAAERVLVKIAEGLSSVSNPMIVEGHTDALPIQQRDYSNWELSNDRANAARRALERAGLARDRIAEVRGYADRDLAVPERPLDPRNRRISILLPFVTSSFPSG